MLFKSVAIASDHAGYELKETVKKFLGSVGLEVKDFGPYSNESVDYPDFAVKVAKKVASGACDRGIMLDGAGIGSSMVCNKVKGIRAALCWSEKTILNSRLHNNANVLTMGSAQHSESDICTMAKLWLETGFEGGRHLPRINKMMAVENINHL